MPSLMNFILVHLWGLLYIITAGNIVKQIFSMDVIGQEYLLKQENEKNYCKNIMLDTEKIGPTYDLAFSAWDCGNNGKRR